MHERVIVERTAAAQGKILKTAIELAHNFELNDQLVALQAATNRDPQIATLLQREAIAALLDGVVLKCRALVERVSQLEQQAKSTDQESTPSPLVEEIVEPVTKKGRR